MARDDALTGPTGSQSSLFTDLRRDLSHLQPARAQAPVRAAHRRRARRDRTGHRRVVPAPPGAHGPRRQRAPGRPTRRHRVARAGVRRTPSHRSGTPVRRELRALVAARNADGRTHPHRLIARQRHCRDTAFTISHRPAPRPTADHRRDRDAGQDPRHLLRPSRVTTAAPRLRLRHLSSQRCVRRAAAFSTVNCRTLGPSLTVRSPDCAALALRSARRSPDCAALAPPARNRAPAARPELRSAGRKLTAALPPAQTEAPTARHLPTPGPSPSPDCVAPARCPTG